MQKYSSVISIERFLVQISLTIERWLIFQQLKTAFRNLRQNLKQMGRLFSSLFSLASACSTGDIAPLSGRIQEVKKNIKSLNRQSQIVVAVAYRR